MTNGNAHRGRDETEIVRRLVQLHRALLIAAGRDRHHGPERHALELSAAIGAHDHRSARVILVGDDVDLAARAEREVGEQMAGRKRRYEKIFGVVDVGVAAENRIGAAGQIGFAVELDSILSAVASVRRGAVAEVAVPDETGLVVVCFFCSRGYH